MPEAPANQPLKASCFAEALTQLGTATREVLESAKLTRPAEGKKCSGKDLASQIKALPSQQKEQLFTDTLRSLKIDLTKFDCSGGGFPLRMLNARVRKLLGRKVTFLAEVGSLQRRPSTDDLNLKVSELTKHPQEVTRPQVGMKRTKSQVQEDAVRSPQQANGGAGSVSSLVVTPQTAVNSHPVAPVAGMPVQVALPQQV